MDRKDLVVERWTEMAETGALVTHVPTDTSVRSCCSSIFSVNRYVAIRKLEQMVRDNNHDVCVTLQSTKENVNKEVIDKLYQSLVGLRRLVLRDSVLSSSRVMTEPDATAILANVEDVLFRTLDILPSVDAHELSGTKLDLEVIKALKGTLGGIQVTFPDTSWCMLPFNVYADPYRFGVYIQNWIDSVERLEEGEGFRVKCGRGISTGPTLMIAACRAFVMHHQQ